MYFQYYARMAYITEFVRNERLQAVLLSANKVVCGQSLECDRGINKQCTFDIWIGFQTPMVSSVQKLIILSDNRSYQVLVFFDKYHKNATSLQHHFQFVISTWIHPRARPTILAVSILPIWYLGINILSRGKKLNSDPEHTTDKI